MKNFLEFLHDYVWGIIVFMFIIVFCAWLGGYIMNGLYGAKFDLASCWAGITAIGGIAGTVLVKWNIDSKNNSGQGEMPNPLSTIQKMIKG